MRSVVVYCSVHGHTAKVAKSIDLPNIRLPHNVGDFDFYVFCCPTYGDEELPLIFEEFLESLHITNKKYTICELGNYYGYDDLEFGVARIIRIYLSKLGWIESFRTLSLDSMPSIDWDKFNIWKHELLEMLK